ncbi:MAG: flagellar protein FlaG [Pseudomonadota bacterium]
MNSITKVTNLPVQIKSVPVSVVPESQKTGNDLPPAVKAATSKPAAVADRQAVEADVKAAVAQMNEYIQSTQRDLHFSYDSNSGETVVKVLDRSTQEVIRQIPDEIFLRLAEQLDKNEPIHFFNAQA